MGKITKSLESYINDFNLVYAKDLGELLKDGYTTPQKDGKQSLISLYDLIVGFNNMYNNFIKAYQELLADKAVIPLGENVEVVGFAEYEDGIGTKINTVSVRAEKLNPDIIAGGPRGTLSLKETNGKTYRVDYIPDRERNDDIASTPLKWIPIKPETTKRYITLFNSYKNLIALYTKLSSLCNVKESGTKIETRFFGNDRELTKGTSGMVISCTIGSAIINISVSFGKTIKFDLKGSSITIDGENIKNDDGKEIKLRGKDCKEILKMLYIDGKYLSSVDEGLNEQKKMIKSLLDSANQNK